jgi:hypothetical protein
VFDQGEFGGFTIESFGPPAMVIDYCQGVLLKEYHPNETDGSREDGRSWREFACSVRQITSRLSPSAGQDRR